MGLDMRPLGKPKPGFEKRFVEIFDIVSRNEIPQPSINDKSDKKNPTEEELLEEWFSNQIKSYETIKAPKVGRDKEADEWVMKEYDKLEQKPTLDHFLKEYEGYYVVELAKEKEGLPMYVSVLEERNVFRGQFLAFCVDLIGEDLVVEAWESKFAEETLDYGNRLMTIADNIAIENNLEYLKTQKLPPAMDLDTIESQLHIVFSLAKWLIFYGKNGHGYEAYF